MQETCVWFLGQEDPLGEGNDNPLQYSCLKNCMDRGACRLWSPGSQKSWTRVASLLSAPPAPEAAAWSPFSRWFIISLLSPHYIVTPVGVLTPLFKHCHSTFLSSVRINFCSNPLPVNFSFLPHSWELQHNFRWLHFQCFYYYSKLSYAEAGYRECCMEPQTNLFPFGKTFSPSKSVN